MLRYFYQRIKKSASFLLICVGAHSSECSFKGKALGQVTPWIAIGLLHVQVVLGFSWMLPAFSYQISN
jgi:hypothetical protein